MSTYSTTFLVVLGTALTVTVACVLRYLQNTLLFEKKPPVPVVKNSEHAGMTATLIEGMGKQLRFLQDIPQDQRTQRHSMQIEYYILAEKCAEIAYMSHQAIVQGEPLHVATAKLGDPATFHAMLARMFIMAQSPPYGYAFGNRIALISTLGPWTTTFKQGDGWAYRLRGPPEEALQSDPGILSGETKAVLKAVAFGLVFGTESVSHGRLGLALLSNAIVGLEANKDSRLALNSFLRGVQPGFSAGDLLWVLYIIYSQKAVEYSMIVSPWGEVPEVLAQAQRCAARACELRPKLPYGFENAASIFQQSGMHESSYMYADKGLRLASELKDDYCIYSMAICKACALIFGGHLPFTLGEVKALKIEAGEASKRAKKYISKIQRTLPEQQFVDGALDNKLGQLPLSDNTPIIKALVPYPLKIQALSWQQSVHGASSPTTSSAELPHKFACSYCKEMGVYMKRCSGCASVSYCCKKCQVQHWKAGHKNNCKKL